MMIQTIFLLIMIVAIVFLGILCLILIKHYKRLLLLHIYLQRIEKQKCAFIQAQERAAKLTKHRINL